MGKKPRLLDDIAHFPAQLHRVLLLNIFSKQEDRSPVRFIQAVGHLQKGGLAASGGAQDGDQLSVPDSGTQIIDREKTVLLL